MRRITMLFVLILAAVATADASSWTFTFNSGHGTVGYGSLVANGSGLGDGSLLVQSGDLTLTSSSDGDLSLGTYSLLPIGPNPVISQSGMFEVDDLIYPLDNAASGVNPGLGGGASYLTNWGLLFGPPSTGSQSEVNLWGNGNSDYAVGSEKGGGYTILTYSGGTFTLTGSPSRDRIDSVPEPNSLMLCGTGFGFLFVFGTIRRRNLLQQPIK